eukprot:TRINITY_DN173_c1_g1_i1.p2 TRINITY_DN173_c1_g1~~TRINITY_DN173_c1_g1_i1.p2  ORF type:complete len:396 (+),score=110.65 TRINITY_DN173_c1_g1_i1:380-1567(+)
MGILYSHIVFQPPVPPTYGDHDGSLTFRRMRSAQLECDDQRDQHDQHDEHATTASNDGSNLGADYVQHPLLYLHTERGNTIAAAFFEQPRSHFTILFSHGNGEDLGVTASYALQLSNTLNTSVLCYDYSGYGISSGKCSERNCYADIRAAYQYLVQQRRVARERIVLFGRSLGSGPTVELAAALGAQLGGVVLIAPLLSCVRVVFNSVASTPSFDMFANVDKIARVRVPVFCVHGMVDNVVPFAHGLQLSRRARFPLEPLWMRDASHNNLESSRFQYEVFLRYMTVLHEFRRWSAPRGDKHCGDEDDDDGDGGALRKVAGCFGPRSAVARSRRQLASRRGGGGGASASYAKLPNALLTGKSVKQLHEQQLRALWRACEQQHCVNNNSQHALWRTF